MAKKKAKPKRALRSDEYIKDDGTIGRKKTSSKTVEPPVPQAQKELPKALPQAKMKQACKVSNFTPPAGPNKFDQMMVGQEANSDSQIDKKLWAGRSPTPRFGSQRTSQNIKSIDGGAFRIIDLNE